MPSRSRKRHLGAIAGEIIHRAGVPAGAGHVIRLSEPPTWHEQLQLMAASLERRPIVILPHQSATVDEWLARYASTEAV